MSWSPYVTGGRSRTVGLILYQIAVCTVVKLCRYVRKRCYAAGTLRSDGSVYRKRC